jgi:plasmid stability protein
MEEESREILRATLSQTADTSLADMIRRRFEPLGGVELELPEREPIRDHPNFE